MDPRDAAAEAIGQGDADSVADVVETQLVDLSHISLSALRDVGPEALAPSVERLMDQVERPRVNLGGGPPGRVD